LRAYRTRLADLDEEIDQAQRQSDLASLARLHLEREQLLAELRRTAGLGGTIRTAANDPAERARKAVSGRIRDAIRRLDVVVPGLAAHLDRSVRTGLSCSYDPRRASHPSGGASTPSAHRSRPLSVLRARDPVPHRRCLRAPLAALLVPGSDEVGVGQDPVEGRQGYAPWLERAMKRPKG
jgi:hypothetical protein